MSRRVVCIDQKTQDISGTGAAKDPNRKSLSSARALGDKERAGADEGDLQGNRYDRSNNAHEGGLALSLIHI